jgi:hypothetical protein
MHLHDGPMLIAYPKYDRNDDCVEDDFRMPYYTALTRDTHLGLPTGTLMNVLRTCEVLYSVGSPTFYGMYHFRAIPAEAFRLKFTKHIGPTNLSSIRHLSMGLPHALKTIPTKFLKRYTRMLETQMPRLTHFELTTENCRWFEPVTVSPSHGRIENHRGLLWFSSWVDRSHPVLNCAVWYEEGTVSGNNIDSDDFWISIRDLRSISE